MSSLKENKMGVQPIGRLLFKMALPMALSMLVQAFYNVVDSAYVAQISDTNQDALNAVSMAFPVQQQVTVAQSALRHPEEAAAHAAAGGKAPVKGLCPGIGGEGLAAAE